MNHSSQLRSAIKDSVQILDNTICPTIKEESLSTDQNNAQDGLIPP